MIFTVANPPVLPQLIRASNFTIPWPRDFRENYILTRIAAPVQESSTMIGSLPANCRCSDVSPVVIIIIIIVEF